MGRCPFEGSKTEGEVGVEFAPLGGEVDGAPAAGDLGEVGRVGVFKAVGCEELAGIEGRAAFRAELDAFLLEEADTE